MVNVTLYLCDKTFSYDDTLVVGVIPLLSALIQIVSLSIVGGLYWQRIRKVRVQTEEDIIRDPSAGRLIMLPVYVSVFWMFIFGSLYSSILSLFFAGMHHPIIHHPPLYLPSLPMLMLLNYWWSVCLGRALTEKDGHRWLRAMLLGAQYFFQRATGEGVALLLLSQSAGTRVMFRCLVISVIWGAIIGIATVCLPIGMCPRFLIPVLLPLHESICDV